MSHTRLTDDAERQKLGEIIRDWAAPWLASDTLIHIDEPEIASETPRWLLRFRGEERDVIAVWLTWRQRTLHVETELMPAPDEHASEIFRYLLVKNAELYPLHVALGPEDGLYLVGRFPIADITPALLDEITGAAVHYVDELFPTVMGLGFPSLYRRRRRR